MLARKRVRVLLRTCFCRGVVSFAHALNCARGGLSGCPQAAVAYGKWLEEQATRKAAKLRYDGARSDGARSGGSQMRQPQPQQPHHHQQQQQQQQKQKQQQPHELPKIQRARRGEHEGAPEATETPANPRGGVARDRAACEGARGNGAAPWSPPLPVAPLAVPWMLKAAAASLQVGAAAGSGGAAGREGGAGGGHCGGGGGGAVPLAGGLGQQLRPGGVLANARAFKVGSCWFLCTSACLSILPCLLPVSLPTRLIVSMSDCLDV